MASRKKCHDESAALGATASSSAPNPPLVIDIYSPSSLLRALAHAVIDVEQSASDAATDPLTFSPFTDGSSAAAGAMLVSNSSASPSATTRAAGAVDSEKLRSVHEILRSLVDITHPKHLLQRGAQDPAGAVGIDALTAVEAILALPVDDAYAEAAHTLEIPTGLLKRPSLFLFILRKMEPILLHDVRSAMLTAALIANLCSACSRNHFRVFIDSKPTPSFPTISTTAVTAGGAFSKSASSLTAKEMEGETDATTPLSSTARAEHQESHIDCEHDGGACPSSFTPTQKQDELKKRVSATGTESSQETQGHCVGDTNAKANVAVTVPNVMHSPPLDTLQRSGQPQQGHEHEAIDAARIAMLRTERSVINKIRIIRAVVPSAVLWSLVLMMAQRHCGERRTLHFLLTVLIDVAYLPETYRLFNSRPSSHSPKEESCMLVSEENCTTLLGLVLAAYTEPAVVEAWLTVLCNLTALHPHCIPFLLKHGAVNTIERLVLFHGGKDGVVQRGLEVLCNLALEVMEETSTTAKSCKDQQQQQQRAGEGKGRTSA